MAEKNSLN